MGPNTLYYGDNLPVMRGHLADASVDLVYLDPPFNSQRNYNVLFKEQSGDQSPAQIKAFTDTWEWSERAYDDFMRECRQPQLIELLRGFVHTLGRNYVTAYLVMMAPRLAELHRVLRPTGSLYLHCDPTASHYLKLLLDATFGARCFRNEIIWKRTTAHSSAKRWGPSHDVLFFYAKSDAPTWNSICVAHSESYVSSKYRFADEGGSYRLDNLTGAGERTGDSGKPWREYSPQAIGRHWAVPSAPIVDALGTDAAERMSTQEKLEWLSKAGLIYIGTHGRSQVRAFPQYKRYLTAGQAIQDVITDIPPINSQARERLGYPTQKPVALLERIVAASSKQGDVVLDPFCGCGTAIVAAQALGRRWIGIDVAHLAVALIKYRLADSFDLQAKRDYAVIGEPTTDSEARALANDDRDEFQKWAVGLVPRAMLFQRKKGADTGIDGLLYFKDDAKDAKKVVIQVKSGHVGLTHARDFAHVMARESATLGLFVTLDPPTGPMRAEADALGFYTTPLGNISIPRFQFRTVGQLLAGDGFHVPSAALLMGVSTAPKAVAEPGQEEMELHG